MEPQRRAVDVRYVALTTLVVVGVTIGVIGSIWTLGRLWRIVTYLLIALFFTVVLPPAVDLLQHRVKMRRGVATLLVCLITFVSLGALAYAFVRPLVDQGQKFADSLPGLIDDARDGEGQIGELIKRYDLDKKYDDNRKAIEDQLSTAGSKGLTVLGTVFSGLIAAITVIVPEKLSDSIGGEKALRPMVQEAAAGISRKIGYRG